MQERELQLSNAASSNFQKEVDDYKRRLRELEEQIQSDDRAEKLENTLKNTQDRSDELEFQLSKLKQVPGALFHYIWPWETNETALGICHTKGRSRPD